MWDWIINIIAQILTWIQMLVGDWGLSIIVLTFLIRLALTPLQAKSIRSTAKMQVLQPKLLEIQERYSDDPQRMNEEMQKFYSENKFNPLGGCLPLLIQMPVLFALFTLLRDIPKYLEVKGDFCFFGIMPDLSASVSGTLTTDPMRSIPYVVALLLFAVLTLIPTLMQARNQTGSQAQSMKTMAIVMSVMMLWIGWSLPAGVLLYYDVSTGWQVIQQIFVTQKVMEKAKEEEQERMENAPLEVDVVRRERRQRPHKKN